MPAKPIPEGYHSLTPNLIVRDAPRARDFYKKAFAATNIARTSDPTGKTMHAEFRVGSAILMMGEESPEYRTLSPETMGGTAVALCRLRTSAGRSTS